MALFEKNDMGAELMMATLGQPGSWIGLPESRRLQGTSGKDPETSRFF